MRRGTKAVGGITTWAIFLGGELFSPQVNNSGYREIITLIRSYKYFPRPRDGRSSPRRGLGHPASWLLIGGRMEQTTRLKGLFRETEGSVLLCVSCGGNKLHDMRVEVCHRDKEDSPTGLSATVLPNRVADITNLHVQAGRDMERNPSPRHDGVRVTFDCKSCPAITELLVGESQGGTYMAIHPLLEEA